MADDTAAGAAGETEGNKAAADPAAAAAAGAADAAGGAAGDKGPEFDWRGAIAGEDQKVAKRMERFTDLPAFGKSYFELDARLNSGKLIQIPDANASKEDLAAFAKMRGIPETPDKYQITVQPPKGMELSENDQTRLKAITARLHKAGGLKADPEIVNIAHEIFYEERIEAEAQMEAAAITAREKAEAYLAKRWPGGEMRRNLMIADQAIGEYFGKDFAEIKDMQMADGTRLGDHPEFIEAFAKIGRATLEDPAFLEAGKDGSDAYQSLSDEKAGLMKLRSANPKEYNSERVQNRLEEINIALNRHKERAA